MNNNSGNNSKILNKWLAVIGAGIALALICWFAKTVYQTDRRQQAFLAEYASNNKLMKADRGEMKRDNERLSDNVAQIRSLVNEIPSMKKDIARLSDASAFVGTHMSDLESLRTEVAKNSKWIDDWYKKLKVPQRDDKQDDAIEILKALSEEERERLRDLEIGYAELGGPNDPLYKEIERLQRAIDKLSP